MRALLRMINGYKTYAGAVGMVLAGLTQLTSAISGDGGDFTTAIGMISAGISAVGLKHSSDKNGVL